MNKVKSLLQHYEKESSDDYSTRRQKETIALAVPHTQAKYKNKGAIDLAIIKFYYVAAFKIVLEENSITH